MSKKRAKPGPIVIAGAGRMGGALIAGWCAKGLGRPIVALDPQPSKQLLALKRWHNIEINPRSVDLDSRGADALVMAVKPQIFAEVAGRYGELARSTLVVSIAAGVSIATMRKVFGSGAAIVRAMPNLPALVGKGISVLVANRNVSARQRRLAGELLGAVGEVVWVEKEAFLDPVTAVSGSGPAYVFLLAECLTRAAVDVGLPPELAANLARATISGAGALIEETRESASILREGVTSPGGTTAAALSVLMAEPGLDGLVRRAVGAATARARELGR